MVVMHWLWRELASESYRFIVVFLIILHRGNSRELTEYFYTSEDQQVSYIRSIETSSTSKTLILLNGASGSRMNFL